MTQPIGIPGERHDQLRLGIKTYESRFARPISEKEIDQGSQAVDFVELKRRHAAFLHRDHYGNRFVVHVIVDVELLRDAVVQDLEIFLVQRAHQFAGGILDGGQYAHQAHVDADLSA